MSDDTTTIEQTEAERLDAAADIQADINARAEAAIAARIEAERPQNVIAALAKVIGELPDIAKDQRSPQGYQYRGIEDMMPSVKRLFSRLGIVPAPRVVSERIEPITVNGKPWSDVILHVEYDLYGPGGVDDMITVGPFVGIGRDNSDKGANKAETQAYKYMLIEVLCIGDGHDSDADEAHEAEARERPAPRDPGLELRNEAGRRIKSLRPDHISWVRDWCNTEGMGTIPKDWDDDQLRAVVGVLDLIDETGALPHETPDRSDEPESDAEPEPAQEGSESVCDEPGCSERPEVVDQQGKRWCATHEPF